MLVHNFLEKSANLTPDKTALIFENKNFTFEQLETLANRFSNALIELGVKKNDRIAIYLTNSIESVISIFAITKIGGIFVIISPKIKSRKLSYILNDCQTKVLITNRELIENYDSNLTKLKTLVIINKNQVSNQQVNKLNFYDFWEIINSSCKNHPNISCIDIDLCSLIYTSGSTGKPKGVMLTHLNMVSAANSIIQYLNNTKDDIIINFLPLAFDYGLYNLLIPLKFGGTVVLEKSFLYPFQLIGLVNQNKVTGLPLIPTIISILLQFQNLEKYSFPTLRYITSTGQFLPSQHIFKLCQLFPNVKIYSMYGLTECKRVSYLPPEELLNRPTSVGKAIPNTEVYLINENGQKITEAETIGELVVRGANVMQGYWNLAEETAKVLQTGSYPSDKILHTGDLFKMDKDGYLYFISRKDNLIKIGGEQVSPKEIENIIYEIKGIKEVAALGVEHKILGQVIKVVIVLKQDVTLTENDIIQYCSLHLEKFMMPKYIEFIEELPKTVTGKVNYTKLLHQ